MRLSDVCSENEAPQFKLDIRDEPIQEEGDAQSALSNVANTLRAVKAPLRDLRLSSLTVHSKHNRSQHHESLVQTEVDETLEILCSSQHLSRRRYPVVATLQYQLLRLFPHDPPHYPQKLRMDQTLNRFALLIL